MQLSIRLFWTTTRQNPHALVRQTDLMEFALGAWAWTEHCAGEHGHNSHGRAGLTGFALRRSPALRSPRRD